MGSTKEKIFRIGIIGCGNIFHSHSQVYPDHPNAVIIGFYDRIKNRAIAWFNQISEYMQLLEESVHEENESDSDIHKKRCKIFKAECKVYDNVFDLIQASDILDICTPNYTHTPYTIWALKAGKKVMSEKPAARCSIETEEILRMVKEHHGIFQINENFLWENFIIGMHDKIKEGVLGKIQKIEIKLGHGAPSWGWQSHFVNPSMSGGGVVNDMGYHAIGAAFGILGTNYSIISIQTITMQSGSKKERRIQDSDGENNHYFSRFMVEDEAKIKIKLMNPINQSVIKCIIECSWSKTYRDIVIIGEKGKIYLQEDELYRRMLVFEHLNGNKEFIPVQIQGRDSHQLAIIDFLSRCVKNQPIRANAQLANQMQTIVSGSYLSHLQNDSLITPADLEHFYNKIQHTDIPETILIEEIIYTLMNPFTEGYYSPNDELVNNTKSN